MKTYKKLGTCNTKHSENVIRKNLVQYFSDYSSSKKELDEFVTERMTSLYLDQEEACEWGDCTK